MRLTPHSSACSDREGHRKREEREREAGRERDREKDREKVRERETHHAPVPPREGATTPVHPRTLPREQLHRPRSVGSVTISAHGLNSS